MTNTIDKLLDRLVLKTQDKSSFFKLSPQQKAIGALELLIGTITRSGASAFFTIENSFLYQDVAHGLELINASESKEIFRSIISTIDKGIIIKKTEEQLQENMIDKHFTDIDSSIREFAKNNFNELSENL